MRLLTVIGALVLGVRPGSGQDRPPPVIDMHVHAFPANDQGPPPVAICAGGVLAPAHDPAGSWTDVWVRMITDPPCADPIWSPRSDEELLAEMIEVLDRNNVIAVTSGPPDILGRWQQAAPERILGAHRFNLVRDAAISPDSLRRALATGRFVALAEVTNQYVGIAPDDAAFEPYLDVAEELDIPVGIHIGTGPPGAPYLAFPEYRARLHSPLTLEEALLRHPRLRVWIMHAGWPMLDDLLAVLWTHPQVHVDLGVIIFALPRAELYRYLRAIVEAGFGDRVMFGSDQMVWPETIERGIRTIMDAPFLTEEQKRDILYDNAARFLRLSDAERARHFRQ